jgi:hypothetical protein
MSSHLGAVTVLTGWCAVLSAGVFVDAASRRGRRRRGEKFVLRNLAYVDESQVRDVDRILSLKLRVGAALLAAMALVIWFVVSRLDHVGWWLYVLAGLFVVVSAVGSITQFARPIDGPGGVTGPRAARSRAVGVGDYVPPFQRWAAIACCGGSLPLVAGCLVLITIGHFDTATILGGPGIWILGTVGLALGAAEFAVRRITDLPQPALDPAHLYLQDALRSRSLADLYGALLLPCMVGWMTVGSDLADAAPASSPTWLVDALPFGFLLAGIVVGLALVVPGLEAEFSTKGPWFRRRLWPMLGPGQVLLPGQDLEAPERLAR